jgi:spore coat protein A
LRAPGNLCAGEHADNLQKGISDGGPYATWVPLGNKGPSFLNNVVLNPHAAANEAEFYYPNQQNARMMWYHDHALGITRLNAYAGIASAYVIREKFEENVPVKQLGLPEFVENGGRELPLVFQDKLFQDPNNLDPDFPGIKGRGNLWYPYGYDPALWDLASVGTPSSVSVVPEMFGDTVLVNGTAYPRATIDQRRYRLRILNACQARFLNLQLYEWNDRTGLPNYNKRGPAFLVIGTEGGLLARPVVVPSAPMSFVGPDMVDPANPGGALLPAPAERRDVVVDFNGKDGKKYFLVNDAPAPFPRGDSVIATSLNTRSTT